MIIVFTAQKVVQFPKANLKTNLTEIKHVISKHPSEDYEQYMGVVYPQLHTERNFFFYWKLIKGVAKQKFSTLFTRNWVSVIKHVRVPQWV